MNEELILRLYFEALSAASKSMDFIFANNSGSKQLGTSITDAYGVNLASESAPFCSLFYLKAILVGNFFNARLKVGNQITQITPLILKAHLV